IRLGAALLAWLIAISTVTGSAAASVLTAATHSPAADSPSAMSWLSVSHGSGARPPPPTNAWEGAPPGPDRPLRSEAVPDSRHRPDVSGSIRIGLDLLPEAADAAVEQVLSARRCSSQSSSRHDTGDEPARLQSITSSPMTCSARKTLPCQRNHLRRPSSLPMLAARFTCGDDGRSGSGGGGSWPCWP